MKKIFFLLLLVLYINSCASEFKNKPGVYALMHTSMGTIVLKLDQGKAPVSSFNFIKYAENDFYKNTVFHRVMPGFMIQGGGFTKDIKKKTDGLRDPIINEWQNGLKNKKYTIAMARTRKPDSATSQFFINVKDNKNLDIPRGGAAYAVFGKVVKGKEVVEKIKNVKCIRHTNYSSRRPVTPQKAVIIKEVTITGVFDRKKLEKKFNRARAVQREKQVRAAEQEKAKIKKTVSRLEKRTGKKIKKTASGLRYIITAPGTGKKPSSPSARVTVHYEGRLLNGNIFDSSYKRKQPATFPLNRVIPGWQEGVAMLRTGATAYFIIPPELGYGARGAGNKIPPDSWLVFKIELLQAE
ncbi:MAG TPA: peptidylprolyl isomerase [Spirochaetota bacterium]|nr:peptidylprolyl isomerase [Spirochaetota bacterium]